MKCMKVETATHELIELLLVGGSEEAVAGSSGEATNALSQSDELRPGERTLQRKQQKEEELRQEAKLLFDHFSQRTLEALIRCTKTTLESIRRRVSSPSSLLYGEATEDKKKKECKPAFKVKLTLAIPNVALKPALEEIQGVVNEAVQHILAVHKGVYQWGRSKEVVKAETTPTAQLRAPSGMLTSIVMQASNAQLGTETKKILPQSFFKAVSEHKEVAKLLSLLSTTISSAKVLVTQALERFKQYEDLWTVDREKCMSEFLESSPMLSDFEGRIREYERLETVVMEEDEELPAGSLILLTGEAAQFNFSSCFLKIVNTFFECLVQSQLS